MDIILNDGYYSSKLPSRWFASACQKLRPQNQCTLWSQNLRTIVLWHIYLYSSNWSMINFFHDDRRFFLTVLIFFWTVGQEKLVCSERHMLGSIKYTRWKQINFVSHVRRHMKTNAVQFHKKYLLSRCTDRNHEQCFLPNGGWFPGSMVSTDQVLAFLPSTPRMKWWQHLSSKCLRFLFVPYNLCTASSPWIQQVPWWQNEVVVVG